MTTADGKDLFAPYLGEDLSRVRISVTTLADLLLTTADRYPDSKAIIFPQKERTYSELVSAAMLRARGLQAAGVKNGDHVGILMPTGPDFVETFFAVALCGGVAVLMNARYKASELTYVVENADMVTLVTTDAVAEHVDFVERLYTAFPTLADQPDPMNLSLAAAPKLRNIVLLGGSSQAGVINDSDFSAAAETVPQDDVHRARLRVRVRDIGMMLYTSGTSANPKGCLITHEAMVRNSINLGRQRWAFTHQERVWSPLPLFHIAALLPLLSVIDAGGTYIGMPVFDGGLALKMIDDYKATAVFSPFVTFHQAMLYHPDFATTEMRQVRVMNSCFGVMPPEVGEAFKKAMPDTLQVGTFGMSEACGIVSTGGFDMDRDLGFTRLGYPLLGVDVRIVDRETGEDLPPNTRGEVLVHGYLLFEGYHRDPEKTAEALDEDGWYHTGDIGSLDDNGHLMFHGRTKDMLKVGGENVAAAEVEAELQKHPAVKLAQVVGLPDPRLDEVVAAFVELKPGASASEQELIDFTRANISSFKVPRHIRFVQEWPMSASKIQKFKLRTELAQELGLV